MKLSFLEKLGTNRKLWIEGRNPKLAASQDANPYVITALCHNGWRRKVPNSFFFGSNSKFGTSKLVPNFEFEPGPAFQTKSLKQGGTPPISNFCAGSNSKFQKTQNLAGIFFGTLRRP